MLSDLLVGLRSLARHRVQTLVILATLAVGIAALAASWSAVDQVLLAPLPFDDPERLVRVRMHPLHDPSIEWESSMPGLRALRDEATSLDGIEGWGTTAGPMVVRLDDGLDRIDGRLVTAGWFDLLGIAPIRGRGFAPTDDVPGAQPVALIGEELWRSRFGGDQDVVGRSFEISGTAFEVVGVMPAHADLPVGAQIWIPVGGQVPEQFLEMPQVAFINPVARLAPDVSVAQAVEEMDSILRRVIHPQLDPARASRTSVTFLADELRAPLRVPSLALLAAAALVLLTGAANVGGLLAVRAQRRRSDFAVRVGLGAGWGDLARLALVETCLLAVAGGLGGALLAPRLLAILVHRFPTTVFLSGAIRVDAGAIVLAAAVSLGLGLVFGVVFASWARRIDAAESLRSGGRGATSTRQPVLRLLVATQVATAVVVALAAGLLLRSVHGLASTDPGFARDGVLTFQVPLPAELDGDPGARNQAHRALLAELGALPGVQAAGGALMRPLSTPVGLDVQVTVEGRAGDLPEDTPLVNLVPASAGWFEATGMRRLDGPGFSGLEEAGDQGVVVLTRSLAERLWQDASPIGARVKWGGPESQQPWLEVVGVVDDVRWRSIESATPTAFVPYTQSGPWGLGDFAVRSAGDTDPRALLGEVRETVRRQVPGSEPLAVATLGDMVDQALAGRAFLATLVGTLAATALLLVGLGLYGLLAFLVAQRTTEIGVRMALGATRRQVTQHILGECSRVAVSGIVLGLAAGLAGALTLGAGLAPHLAGHPVLDPWTFLYVPIVVVTIALVAGFLPARRASRFDPAVALRSEG